MAASKNRSITGPQTGGLDLPRRFDVDAAASVHVYGGTLVARDVGTTGRPARPASANLSYIVHGFADNEQDNSSGAQGDKVVGITSQPGYLGNSASTDAITDADLFKMCYVVDDQTVARTSNAGARPVAGMILGVDSVLGVLVYPNPTFGRANLSAARAPVFFSTEQTGTGSAQNVAHGLGIVPAGVIVWPTDLTPATVGSYTVTEGTHTSTNVVVTVTTSKKFKVFAWA